MKLVKKSSNHIESSKEAYKLLNSRMHYKWAAVDYFGRAKNIKALKIALKDPIWFTRDRAITWLSKLGEYKMLQNHLDNYGEGIFLKNELRKVLGRRK